MNALFPYYKLALTLVALVGFTLLQNLQGQSVPSTGVDIGAVSMAGSTVLSANGVYTITGCGSDIWGSLDAFQFASQNWSGNGEITARVTSIQNANSWSKAGVMLRNSTDPGAANVFMAVTLGGNGITFQVRATNGAGTACTYTGTASKFPVWLRLSQQGKLVSGSYSSDGITWTVLGQTTITLNNPLLQGLAVTSHTTTASCAAVFDNVTTSTTPAFAIQTSKPPTGLTTSLITDSQAGLTWTTLSPFIATSYNIYRNGVYVGSSTGNNFVDSGLSASSSYQYTVSSVNASNQESVQSAPITVVTTQSAGLPYPWTHMELGLAPVSYIYALNTINPGSSLTHIIGQSLCSTTGVFTVSGGGTQTEDGQTIDAGQFVYQQISGDTSITIHLDGFVPVTGQAGYVGPMIRESTSSGSPVAWGYVAGNSQGFEYRQTAGTNSLNETSSLTYPIPVWMNLQRQGNIFTYSISSDGIHWQLLGQQTIAMSSQVLVGFAVGSGSNTALAQAQIDQVSFGTGANLFPQTESNQVSSNLQVISTVASDNGSQGAPLLGNWTTYQNGIIDHNLRGSVQFNLSVNQGDIYELSVQGQPQGTFNPTELYNLLLSVDGTFLGSYSLTSLSGAVGEVHCLTPYLKAGNHTVTVYWDNSLVGRNFEIDKVSLNTVGAQSGSEAWEQSYIASNDTLDQVAATSVTSPYCAEGNATFPELVTLSNGVAQHGAGSRWYANVPLLASGPTSYTVTFDQGGSKQTGQAQWLPTELLSASNLTIRQGDSLLFTVLPQVGATGNAQITVGKTSYNLPVGGTQPYAFSQAGTFTVTGTVVGGQTHSIQVTVVGGSFNGSPLVWVGRQRVWDCPLIAPAPTVTVHPDSRVAYQESPDGKGGSQFILLIDAAQPRYVVARLGAAGPILANTVIQGTDIEASNQTGVQIVQTYPDGSQLVQMLVVASTVTPTLSVKISIFVGGVTFADGTTTETLTAANFNSLGEAVVSFIYPAGAKTSVCHNLQVFDGSSSIGSQ